MRSETRLTRWAAGWLAGWLGEQVAAAELNTPCWWPGVELCQPCRVVMTAAHCCLVTSKA
jgi:hypothetical protein